MKIVSPSCDIHKSGEPNTYLPENRQRSKQVSRVASFGVFEFGVDHPVLSMPTHASGDSTNAIAPVRVNPAIWSTAYPRHAGSANYGSTG